MVGIAQMVGMLAALLSWVIAISVMLTYILSPYHPVRMALDQMLEPLLSPIRRIMPSTGMIDFSPLILIVLIQMAARLIIIAVQ